MNCVFFAVLWWFRKDLRAVSCIRWGSGQTVRIPPTPTMTLTMTPVSRICSTSIQPPWVHHRYHPCLLPPWPSLLTFGTSSSIIRLVCSCRPTLQHGQAGILSSWPHRIVTKWRPCRAAVACVTCITRICLLHHQCRHLMTCAYQVTSALCSSSSRRPILTAIILRRHPRHQQLWLWVWWRQRRKTVRNAPHPPQLALMLIRLLHPLHDSQTQRPLTPGWTSSQCLQPHLVRNCSLF